MLDRNPHFESLETNYLFPEIRARANKFSTENPTKQLLTFGIGDVSLPLAPTIVEAMQKACLDMGTSTGFKGYGPEQGYNDLREQISRVIYATAISGEEIFISDGAKCDIGRLFTWLHPNASIALQTPCYPAFADAWKIVRGTSGLRYLECDPLTGTPLITERFNADVIVLVNPNNPTGHLMDVQRLSEIIILAAEKGSIIIYDSAYRAFIQDPNYPRSIYDLPKARECVIEIGSFSKSAGFTGVRLGWTAIPEELVYKGRSLRAHSDYRRLIQTLYNGASYIAQVGGLAALSPLGQAQIQEQIQTYLARAAKLASSLRQIGWEVSGGEHSPFVWARPCGSHLSSWQLFDLLLSKYGWITTPGSGFGSCADGFVRFSAFANSQTIDHAISQMSQLNPHDCLATQSECKL